MRTSGEVAVCFWKKEWDGLTKNGGSGTMRVNEGGFGLVPYLCKGIVTRSCGCLLPKKCLHLTYVKGLLPAEKGAPGTTGTLHLTYVEGLLLGPCEIKVNNIYLHLTRPRTKNRSSQKGRSGQTFLRSSLNSSRSLAIFLLEGVVRRMASPTRAIRKTPAANCRFLSR